jgi:hypothetical protein
VVGGLQGWTDVFAILVIILNATCCSVISFYITWVKANAKTGPTGFNKLSFLAFIAALYIAAGGETGSYAG